MIGIGEEALQEIKETFSKVSIPKDPFAILKESSIILTDSRVLLEWPIDVVDTECKAVRKLIRAGETKGGEFLTTPWTKLLAPEKSKYFLAQRVEQTETEKTRKADDDPDETYTYSWKDAWGSHRCTFKRIYLDMVEGLCVGEVKVYIYAGTKYPVLIISEDGKRVSALAPQKDA